MQDGFVWRLLSPFPESAVWLWTMTHVNQTAWKTRGHPRLDLKTAAATNERKTSCDDGHTER